MPAFTDNLRFTIEPMTEAHAMAVCSWRYEPPYDRYNWEPWETMASLGKEFADPHIRTEQYRSALLDGDKLAGFVQLFPLSGDDAAGTIRLGLGLRPDLCGLRRGIGAALAREAALYALGLYPGWSVDLEVAADNLRAIAAYERAGFVRTDSYELRASHGTTTTYCMVWGGPER
ncbi:GNAT family N-acetyltransferase [Paenibacillus thermotolerans]|uniref:GNAT family N-acetyltransferase n=1 Tax=Paenibacillus thermotolerans TaxID=3027807 RepID=UPI0023674BF0|nr:MULTISPECIES: GNAT family N-acetyltransferase [unclassified Paenibacillus]